VNLFGGNRARGLAHFDRNGGIGGSRCEKLWGRV